MTTAIGSSTGGCDTTPLKAKVFNRSEAEVTQDVMWWLAWLDSAAKEELEKKDRAESLKEIVK